MTSNFGLMSGKRVLILGVGNDKSLAWAIAKILSEHGAEIILTYAGDIFKKRVEPLSKQINCNHIFNCDVSKPEDIEELYNKISSIWCSIDCIVHAIAFSDKDELNGRYIDVSLKNFLNSMHISCYSFTNIARVFEPLMKQKGGSLLTLTYYGAEKVVPHYNVMGLCKSALEASVKYLAVDMGGHGIRVNAISAGAIRTLASAGIGDFNYILEWNKYNSPLKRNTTCEDVAGAALYLLSDLGAGTTGEILHVDAGYNIVGMKAVDAPDIVVPKKEVISENA